MNRYGYGTRLLSLMLAMIMIFSMIPALQQRASAAQVITSTNSSISTSNKITMPIKIMDYESDGMLFEYLWGNGSHTRADYVPESKYWIDYTGSLAGLANLGTTRNIAYGTGFTGVSLNAADGTYNGQKWANFTKSSLGGKQLLNVENVKTTNIPLQWQIASFTSTLTAADVRYCAVIFRAYNCDGTDPTLGIGTKLSEDLTTRYQEGTWSGHYHINTTGRNTVAGDRYVDVAIIDLSKITTSFNTLYLEFPQVPAEGDDPKFNLIGVYFTPNEGDAWEYAAWASSLGSAADTDTYEATKSDGTKTTITLPRDNLDNQYVGFSLWHYTTSTFTDVSSLPEWLRKAGTKDYGYGMGDYVVYVGNKSEIDLSTASASSYESTYGSGSLSKINISDAIGYKLFQIFGDNNGNHVNNVGNAAIGLMQSSLDENGLPQYKKSVLEYMRIYLRNVLKNCHQYDLDGWRNYTTISGGPNGDIFGWADGGQIDHDPNKAGIQGIPKDFATAICDHMGVKRRALDYAEDYGKTNNGTGNYQQIYKGYPGEKTGSYEETMARREFLEGSWLECKQYITSWWDLAYYMMHNLWVPNSYNELQSDYNYLEMYKDSATGNYVFDSAFSDKNGKTTVSYNKTTKTIGLTGGSYTNTNGNLDATYPFLPVNLNSVAGESVFTNVLENSNALVNGKNFHYTIACNGMFTFAPGQKFHFDGDDDVYLYVNGELVMDLGGTHNNTCSTIQLDKYVDWAQTVLKNTKNYSAEEIRRAEKLNLKRDENYTFDFFYVERKAAGANLRIETNIKIFVPPLDVEKKSYQNGEQIPDNGVIDNSELIEYGFTLTNDNETAKLYNLEFIDNDIGVTLDPTNGLLTSSANVCNKNGDPLGVTDLVAVVEGYDGNPRRPSTNKLDPITVTFKNKTELTNFLKNLASAQTGSGLSEGLYSGDGLWAYASVTIRGIYYKQDKVEQTANSFTNEVTVRAYNGAYMLTGFDDHTVFKFGDPSYFQWAGNKIVVDSSKLYHDLKESPTYWDEEIPDYGHMVMTLCDATGVAKSYAPFVTQDPGGDAYIEINYPTPGLKFFYLRIDDRCGKQDSFVLTLAVYVLDVKDSAVVLDYGLTANLSGTGGIVGKDDTINIAGKKVLNTVIGITGVGGQAEYVEMDSTELENLYDDATKHNVIDVLNGGATEFTGKLEHPIFLAHDMPWVIEFKVTSPDGGLLFSDTESASTTGNTYLFMCPSTGYIAMGQARNDIYQNYGAWADATPNANGVMTDGKPHTYRLVNVIDGNNSNMVYLYVDGVLRGALDDYHKNGGAVTDTAQDPSFVAGRDFSFSYIGPGANQRVDIERYEYIRVWEQGLELNNYRWETVNGTLKNVSINDKGNAVNAITQYTTDSTTNRDVVLNSDGSLKEIIAGTASNGKYYKMAQNVMLQHTKEWVIEFQYSGLDANPNDITQSEEAMIFSSLGTSSGAGHEYLYLRADNGQVTIGRIDAAGYHNYGLALKEIIPGFNTSEKHTYRLENRLTGKDGAMVYLIVDGEEIGPMDHYYLAGTFINDGKDFFSGNDFSFSHIGNKTGQWAMEGTLHYLQVWEDTALNGSYGWQSSGEALEDMFPGMPDGNRIDFEATLTGDDKIETEEGYFFYKDNDLYFQPTGVMDKEYSVKIAFATHELNFTPTDLAEKYVDVCNEVQMFKNIVVVPANVVYYEDDFPAIKYDCSSENGFEVIGTSSGLTQSPDTDSPYGNDPVYNKTLNNYTGETLHVLPINKLGPLAHFEFTGTGFEIVARTNAFDSGILFVDVYEAGTVNFDSNGNVKYDEYGIIDATAEPVAFVPVVTGYDNNMNGGVEEVYAVPLINVMDLAFGNYIVVITGVPTYEYEEDGTEVLVDTKLYLDGIRVFHPLDEDLEEEYYTDMENGVYFDEIRDFVEGGNAAAAEWADMWTKPDGEKTNELFISSGLTTWTENPLGLNVEGNKFTGQKVSSMDDYLTLGPNNEVYMDGTFTNSALVLMVENSGRQGHTLQIAMRAMDYGVFVGAGHIYEAAKVMISYNNEGNSEWKELVTIRSAAEQYYSIPYTECPMVGDYYMVALKIEPVYKGVPALVSFSSIKYKGMAFENVNSLLSSGSGEVSVDEISNDIYNVLSSTTVYTENESAPGKDFGSGSVSGNAPALLPKYPTLSFEDEIRYNIYFTAQNLESYNTADMGLITFDSRLINGTIDDAIDVIPGATFNGTEFMVHTNGISAKKMGDTVYFKIYTKLADGTYLYSDVFGYSALKYAQDCLEGNYSEKLQSLIVAMLNYGSAAQEYFGYKANIPMNEGLSAAQQTLAAQYDASMVKPLTAVDATKAQNFVMSAGSYSAVYPSVSFDGAFALNFYFQPSYAVDNGMTFYYWTEEAYNAADVLTVDNASGKSQMVANGAEYGAVISGIAAKEMSDAVYVVGAYESNGVTYYTNVITYSLGQYCKTIAANASSDAQALAAATAVYGYYAEAYFAE